MTVLTIGTFDLLHEGHIELLKRCEKLGEVIVGLNTDEFVEEYKGKKPVMCYRQRRVVLQSIKYVNAVVPNQDSGRNLILFTKPDYLIVGSDWARKDYYKQIGVTQEELNDNGIELMYLPYTQGISSSEIKKNL